MKLTPEQSAAVRAALNARDGIQAALIAAAGVANDDANASTAAQAKAAESAAAAAAKDDELAKADADFFALIEADFVPTV